MQSCGSGEDAKMEKMKTILFIFLTTILLSCNQTVNKSSNSTPLADKQVVIGTIDFCKICDSLDTWQGGIQGVNVSDSTRVYPFAECHTNKFFDLIWVPKGDILKFKDSIGFDNLFKYYDNSKKEKYKNLDCYSFVITKKKHIPEKNNNNDGEDLDTYDYIFPNNVSVFKKIDKGWALITTKNVKSFEELGRLKLNTIFHTE